MIWILPTVIKNLIVCIVLKSNSMLIIILDQKGIQYLEFLLYLVICLNQESNLFILMIIIWVSHINLEILIKIKTYLLFKKVQKNIIIYI